MTPMICAYFVRIRRAATLHGSTAGSKACCRACKVRLYDRTLSSALEHRRSTPIVFAATIVLSVGLYIKVPKGYFPEDDT